VIQSPALAKVANRPFPVFPAAGGLSILGFDDELLDFRVLEAPYP